jgi:hypothetical protein|uniref:hypothetical protein n=1 Tax=Halomonas sp. TaxID=1486246 RepID=UPI0026106859|nr:hypothetical protein [Halomonas sp.]
MIRRRKEQLIGLSPLPVVWAAVMLGISVLLAIWLLLQPWLISGLPLILRLPLIILGLWAVGGGLALPLHYSGVPGWWLMAGQLPWYPVVLALFTLMLLMRSWMM